MWVIKVKSFESNSLNQYYVLQYDELKIVFESFIYYNFYQYHVKNYLFYPLIYRKQRVCWRRQDNFHI